MGCGLITGFIVWALLRDFGALGVAAGVLAGLIAAWIEAQLWPIAPCLWCRGRRRTSYSWCTPTAFRKCWWCRGSGERRRLLAGGGLR